MTTPCLPYRLGRAAVEGGAQGAVVNRSGFLGGSNIREYGAMKKTTNFSPEVRERAVRMVREHQGEHDSEWAAIGSVAASR